MNFQIESTSFCNLTCRECVNVYMQRKRESMTMEVWQTIIDRYVIPFRHINANGPPAILPHKDGESLLHKELPVMLAYAASKVPEANIDIYTHGLLLPRKPDFIPFLGSLPNKVRLLISFHFYNHDGSENDYGPLADYLRQAIPNRPRNVEIILASHLIAPMTRDRLESWANEWRPYGISVHANANINPWTGLMNEVATSPSPKMCIYEQFHHMFFGVTGNVIACCLDLEEEIVFGNVMRDDPEVMFGTVGAFYAAQRRREHPHIVCNDCYGLPRGPKQEELLQLAMKTRG